MCNLPPQPWMGDFKKQQFTQGCSCKHKSTSVCTTHAFSYKQTNTWVSYFKPLNLIKTRKQHHNTFNSSNYYSYLNWLQDLLWNYLTTFCILKNHSWRWVTSPGVHGNTWGHCIVFKSLHGFLEEPCGKKGQRRARENSAGHQKACLMALFLCECVMHLSFLLWGHFNENIFVPW